jgi:thiol-disulfide isomerase/thioredoxin
MRAFVPALCVLSLVTACGSRPAPVAGAGNTDRPAPADPPEGSDAPAPAPAPDDHGPDISLLSLDGKTSSFRAHRAPVTVVALWATYCGPCLRELHLIEALHARYRADEDVTVLLVSVDDAEQASRDAITRLLRERKMTVPALIDHSHALMNRLAPRDTTGQPYQAVPMLVVVDERFRLRRKLDLGHSLDDDVFLAQITPLVDAARRGDAVPPDEPYEPPLGSGFLGKRTITLTVDDLAEEDIGYYMRDLRYQLATMYPDLHDHQLDVLLVEIEKKLRADRDGPIKIEIPPGHAGAH